MCLALDSSGMFICKLMALLYAQYIVIFSIVPISKLDYIYHRETWHESTNYPTNLTPFLMCEHGRWTDTPLNPHLPSRRLIASYLASLRPGCAARADHRASLPFRSLLS